MKKAEMETARNRPEVESFLLALPTNGLRSKPV
jgi:hypothetical protein